MSLLLFKFSPLLCYPLRLAALGTSPRGGRLVVFEEFSFIVVSLRRVGLLFKFKYKLRALFTSEFYFSMPHTA